MMREIKFKAYHKEKKKMYDVIDIRWGIDLKTGVIFPSMVALRNDEETHYLKKILFVDFDKVELLEYIGDKDVNGKEVYGGYIVRFTIPEDTPKNEREVREIVWIQNMGGFQARSMDGRFTCFFHAEQFEIIGDIYQNPELKEG